MPHDTPVLGAEWSQNEDRVLTWSLDGAVRIWGQDDSPDFQTVYSLELGEVFDTFRFQQWSADESRIFAGYTSFLWVIDAATGETLTELSHNGPIQGFEANKAGSLVFTWVNDGTAQLWDAITGQELLVLNHPFPVRFAAWSQDESRLLTRSQQTVHAWNVSSGEELTRIVLDSSVLSVRWSEDESLIITSDLQVWDAESGEEVYDLGDSRWSLDGNLIANYPDENVHIVDVRSGETRQTLSHPERVAGALFNQDRSQLATWVTDGDGGVFIWDINTGERVLTIPTAFDIRDIQWSQDDEHLLAWSRRGSISLWNTSTGEEIRRFDHELPFSDVVRDVKWDQTQGHILTVTGPGNLFCEAVICSIIHLWDIEDGQQILSIPLVEIVDRVRFGKDKKRILVDDSTGFPRAWVIDFDELLILAGEKRIYPLPNDARETFFLPTVEPSETPIPPTMPPRTYVASPTVATYTPASAATQTLTPSPTSESTSALNVAGTATQIAHALQATSTVLASEPLQAPQNHVATSTRRATATPFATVERTPMPTMTPLPDLDSLGLPFNPLDPSQMTGFDRLEVLVPEPLQILDSEEIAAFLMPGGGGIGFRLRDQSDLDQTLIILQSQSPYTDLQAWQTAMGATDDLRITVERSKYQIEFVTMGEIEVAIVTGPIRPATISSTGQFEPPGDPADRFALFIYEGVYVSIQDQSDGALETVIEVLVASFAGE